MQFPANVENMVSC